MAPLLSLVFPPTNQDLVLRVKAHYSPAGAGDASAWVELPPIWLTSGQVACIAQTPEGKITVNIVDGGQ